MCYVGRRERASVRTRGFKFILETEGGRGSKEKCKQAPMKEEDTVILIIV